MADFEIDKITGLPKEITDFGQISKEKQKIKISVRQRKFRKFVTTLTGFESEKEAKRMGKELKKYLACGGSVDGTQVELQGSHAKKAKELLLREGYKQDQIDL